MSDNTNFGFARLVPGFDFLQNLAKGASQGMPPQLSNWVAPTLDLKELDKRISDLKAVAFWLDQNSKALSATIQAMEVQKMTLATLQGMNFSMGEVADALKLKTPEAAPPAAGKSANAAAAASSAATAAKGKPGADKARATAGNGTASAPVDPLQWWGALTQQFQEIAATAMKDVAQKAAPGSGKTTRTAAYGEAAKPAKKSAARRPAARKRVAQP